MQNGGPLCPGDLLLLGILGAIYVVWNQHLRSGSPHIFWDGLHWPDLGGSSLG